MFERIRQFISMLRRNPEDLGRLGEDEIFGNDAHNHTPCSDGMHSLPYLILLHRRYGFPGMAVTDHDFVTLQKWSLGAWYIRSLGCLAGVKIYPGAEFSCRLPVADLDMGKELLSLHITGLGISPDASMRIILDSLSEGREIHSAGILERIRQNRPELILPEKINKGYGVKTSTDIAREICRLNPGEDFAALLHTLITDKEYRVVWEKAGAREAIRAINESGGVAVWAHPVKTLKGDFIHFEKVALRLVELGIGGIEAFARGQTLLQTIGIIRFCRLHGLKAYGGADTHWEKHLTDYADMIKEYAESPELIYELVLYRQARRTCFFIRFLRSVRGGFLTRSIWFFKRHIPRLSDTAFAEGFGEGGALSRGELNSREELICHSREVGNPVSYHLYD